MPTLDQVNDDVLYSLFKGEPGTRKSTAALSYPLPQYWFSTDRKMGALKLPMRALEIDAKQVTYDDYSEFNPIRAKLELLQVNCPYKTIIIDSATSFGDATNSQALRIKSTTTRKSGEAAGIQVGGISVNSLEDYKAEASAFNQLIALTKDIQAFHKVNIIIIAHVIGERNKTDQAQSTHFSRIIVTGGKIISAKIPAYCGEVYHFNVRPSLNINQEDEYGLVTRHTGDDFARTGLPLPREVFFNNKSLYKEFIKPAIEKLQKG